MSRKQAKKLTKAWFPAKRMKIRLTSEKISILGETWILDNDGQIMRYACWNGTIELTQYSATGQGIKGESHRSTRSRPVPVYADMITNTEYLTIKVKAGPKILALDVPWLRYKPILIFEHAVVFLGR